MKQSSHRRSCKDEPSELVAYCRVLQYYFDELLESLVRYKGYTSGNLKYPAENRRKSNEAEMSNVIQY